MKNRYFRAGVGSVIYKDDGKVLWFKRSKHPIGMWQFQQGGIDLGETFEGTLWRELDEETGLCRGDFSQVIMYPDWTLYQYDEKTLQDEHNPEPDRLGQVHRWYFLKLRKDVEIDLQKATDKEFADYEWTTFEKIRETQSDYKKNVYEKLHDYFKSNILQNLKINRGPVVN